MKGSQMTSPKLFRNESFLSNSDSDLSESKPGLNY